MIQLNYGDKLRFTCSFQHKGAAYTGAKLHAAIGNKGTFGFDEIINNEITVTGIINDSTWQNYTVTIDITITSVLAGGAYDTMVKLISIPGSDIYWYGALDDIVIAGAAEFQNLSVSYAKV